MKKIFNKIIEVILGILSIVLFLYFQFFGIYHAFSKHGVTDGLIASFIPPYSWYRAAEFWWHDDYANTDWETTLTIDTETVLYLMNVSFTDATLIASTHSTTEEFSKKINGYPEDKKKYLKEVTDLYIKFSLSFFEDEKEYIKIYNSDLKQEFESSSQTKKYEENLKEYQGTESIITIFKELNRNDLKLIDQYEDPIRLQDWMETYIKLYKENLYSKYKNIFKEDYVAATQNLLLKGVEYM